jgi:hypothetical protein
VQLLRAEETLDAVLLVFAACKGGTLYHALQAERWGEARLRDQASASQGRSLSSQAQGSPTHACGARPMLERHSQARGSAARAAFFRMRHTRPRRTPRNPLSRRRRPAPPPAPGRTCVQVVVPLLRVLSQLHAMGLVHRDVK